MAVLAGILIIGVPLGVIAGYKDGMIDGITMRMVDIVCTFPSSLVGLAVVGILDPGLQNIMLVLVSLWWAPLARMVRGEVLQIQSDDIIGTIINVCRERQISTVCVGKPNIQLLSYVRSALRYKRLLNNLAILNIDLIILGS